MATISVNDFVNKWKSNPHNMLLVDVRAQDEFAIVNIPGAINLPLDEIEQGKCIAIPQGKDVYMICQSGKRSQRARALLAERGITNVFSVEGGMAAFQQEYADLVCRNSNVIPLMRQIQIVAGLLVLISILLAKLVHPGFIGLAVFVGLGQLVAGFTGFCGMALLLERLPWNKKLLCHIDKKCA